MKQNKLFVIFILLMHSCIQAQEKSDTHKSNDILMREQIKKLKNGSLLVRLFTNQNSIDALKRTGHEDLAKERELSQRKFNINIISAFKKKFTFCPVYFFYSHYSDTILSGNIKNVMYLNDSLEEDLKINLTSDNYLTAEFGVIEQDTAKYYAGDFHSTNDRSLQGSSYYNGGPDLGFNVLKIMSDKLVQLKRPFPYYVKSYSAYPNYDRILKSVSKIDKKLAVYFEVVEKVK